MFTFILKENKADIEIVITRILLAVAGVISLFFGNYMIGLATAIILLAISYFVKTISKKFRISRPVLLIVAAIVLFIGTGSYIFSGILLCYALLLQVLQKRPEVFIDKNKIVLKKVFMNETYEWTDFNNIILKDGLLTLDFTDNKLLQLYIDDRKTTIYENFFNSFCSEQLIVVK
ncbi:MAG TPA: hypothetical protein VK559_11845 [Ferruginibacter sp.]|nr:hypothetical protein [Ferruginibacter sp.]